MSGEINKPANPTHFLAHDSEGNVSHVGITHPNQVTTTGQPNLKFSDDPEVFLEQTGAVPMEGLPELPVQGEEVALGVYQYEGNRVVARQAHTRTEFPPEETPALFAFQQVPVDGEVLPWIAQESVALGWKREYEGTVYTVLQAHTTQSDWTPPETPALWEVDSGGGSTTEWVPGQTVVVGDQRTYDGNLYECLQGHTTQTGWEPPSTPALWADLGAV